MKPINIITGDRRNKNEQHQVKLVLPALSKFPTIRGQWQPIGGGKTRAWYTPEQYAQCKKMFEMIKDARPVRPPTSEDK